MREVKAVYKVNSHLGYGVVVWVENNGVPGEEAFFAEVGRSKFVLPDGTIGNRFDVLTWARENLN